MEKGDILTKNKNSGEIEDLEVVSKVRDPNFCSRCTKRGIVARMKVVQLFLFKDFQCLCVSTNRSCIQYHL